METEQVSAIDIPKTLPYASGHGSRVTVPSAAVVDEQVPSRYMASKIFHGHKYIECREGKMFLRHWRWKGWKNSFQRLRVSSKLVSESADLGTVRT